MSRHLIYRTGAALVLAGVALACSSRLRTLASPETIAPVGSTVDRMTVRTGEQ